MSHAISSTLSMIPLAAHQVAPSTMSATAPTAHFAISPALSIAHPARSHAPPARSPTIHPAHFTASHRPQATHETAHVAPSATEPATSHTHFATPPAASTAQLATDHAASTAPFATSVTPPATSFTAHVAVLAALPARSAAHQTTPHAILPAPLTASHRPHATHHAIAHALPTVHFSIDSREKSPHPKKAAIRDPRRMTRSFGSKPRPVAFQAKIIMIAHKIPAAFVLYHKRSHAPASISQIVATQNRKVVGSISRKGRSFPAADQTNSTSLAGAHNFVIQAQRSNAPAITRIIHKIFQFIMYINRR